MSMSCDFSKLTILYIHVQVSVYSIISKTNKSVMTFLYVNKISVCLSVCLSVCDIHEFWKNSHKAIRGK